VCWYRLKPPVVIVGLGLPKYLKYSHHVTPQNPKLLGLDFYINTMIGIGIMLFPQDGLTEQTHPYAKVLPLN